MALGLSGSKGGIIKKEKVIKSDYVDLFRKLIDKDESRINKTTNESGAF